MFEIAVKEAQPKLVMTAYNVLNGLHTSENAELITGILRNEWDYKGLVTTDWWNTGKAPKEKIAGNDIRMPSRRVCGKPEIDDGIIEGVTRNELAVCVKRLLEMILWLE